MKVLLISPYFYPHKGGLEQFNFELAKRLSKDFSIRVLSSKLECEKNNENIGFEITRVPHLNILGGTFPIPKNIFDVFRTIKAHNPDIVITSTRFFPINFWASFFLIGKKIKHYHIEHGSKYVTLSNPFFSFLSRLYDQTCGRFVISRADKVFGISKSCVNFSKMLGARNTGIIYNSVDCKFFDGAKNLSEETTHIAFVGRLIFAKGIHELIQAFKAQGNQDCLLHIAGSGNYRAELEKFANGDKSIIFHGELNQKEIKDLLKKTDIFVNPSYNEGLPTSVLEAGAMKCAVLATDVGGTNEIIDDSVNGFLIRPSDESKLLLRLKTLIENKKIRANFSSSLHSHVNKTFCWDQTAAKFIKELDK